MDIKQSVVAMALVGAQIRDYFSPAQRLADSKERAAARAAKRVSKMRGWSASGNGARECARRRAQIAKGMLKRENGLSAINQPLNGQPRA